MELQFVAYMHLFKTYQLVSNNALVIPCLLPYIHKHQQADHITKVNSHVPTLICILISMLLIGATFCCYVLQREFLVAKLMLLRL